MPRHLIEFEDFNPNDPFYSSTVFGVWADDAFKLYTSRASALNRFSHWPRAKMYEYVPVQAEWVLRGVKDPDNAIPCCTVCGGTTFDHPRHYAFCSDGSYGYVPDYSRPKEDCGGFMWERKSGKITPTLIGHYACRACQENNV